jgi:Fe-S cluster biogenesis protein NfuA/nitrite reductase/ring-hydroxylating ferredoxin subunit
MQVEERELAQRAAQIESLLGEIERFPDGEVRARVEEIVQGLLLLYGQGLSRMLEIIWDETGEETSARLFAALSGDDLIAHLLLLHDLHPVPLEARILSALDHVRPYLESHGGNVELLGVENGVAKLRLQGSCSGCPSSTATLKLAIEEAILQVAPDVRGIEAEGATAPAPQPIAFVPTSELTARKGAGRSWIAVSGPNELLPGEMRLVDVSGRSTLFCKVDETLYAYHDVCPACGSSLDATVLQEGEIVCSRCGNGYDIRLAGRCRNAPQWHLEPIPLLVRDGTVRVAVHG